MADRYLDDTNGSPSSPYESAATAANALSDILGLTIAVGEKIFVPSGHDEALNTTFTAPTAATPSSPQQFLAVDNLTDKNLLSSAAVTYSASNSTAVVHWNGNWYFHGIVFNHRYTSSSSVTPAYGFSTVGPHIITFNKCSFQTGSLSARHLFGNSANTANERATFVFNDCELLFSSTTGEPSFRFGTYRINGLTLGGTGGPLTSLFQIGSQGIGYDFVCENSDLTGIGWTNLIDFSAAGVIGEFVFRNCKFPAAWTAYTGAPAAPGWRIVIDACDDGSEVYQHARYEYSGSVILDTGIYATTNPATDGVTSYSWRMATTANASKFLPLYSEWANIWNDTTGSSVTVAFEVLVSGDGASALNDNDVWIEVDAMTTASVTKATRTTDAPNILASGSAQDAGTTAWTGDGYTTERTHKLSVSVTPTQKGYIRARVALAKASTTVYVNPNLSLS